jgi:PTS system nitrogen regulatory IIA component
MSKKIELGKVLKPDQIAYDVRVSSKKRALEVLSELLARGEPQLTSAEIFDSLVARERLGATGLGKGVALPHGRLRGAGKLMAAFQRLKGDVAFDAADKQPVDLLFALMVPEDSKESNEEYLQVLAHLAEMLSDEELRMRLRTATSCEELFDLITRWKPSL